MSDEESDVVILPAEDAEAGTSASGEHVTPSSSIEERTDKIHIDDENDGDADESHEREVDTDKAEKLKAEGNAQYSGSEFEAAIVTYTRAIQFCEPRSRLEAICYGNRAACHINLGRDEEGIRDCSRSLQADGKYVKVLLRRSAAFERIDKMSDALEDAKRVLEIDGQNPQAAATVAKLEPRVREIQEKEKEKMFADLKKMGNSILGRFGLSTDNFKVQQDEKGSYNISFDQGGGS